MTLVDNSMDLVSTTPKTAKSGIIHLLSKQWPLTAKQFGKALERQYGLSVTYQAIHKALSELEHEHVVEKTTKGYQLGEGWIAKLNQLSHTIAQNYSQNKPLDFDKEITQFKFSNWIETGRFVAFDFKEKAPNPDKKPTIICWIHTWPVNTVSIEETQRIAKFARIQTHYCICSNNTPLDQTASIYLKKMHMHPATGAHLALDHDYCIQGDHIVHIYYEKTFLKKVDDFFQQTNNIRNIDLIRLQKLVTEKTNITVIIIKNAELADQLRNEALALFPKKGRKK